MDTIKELELALFSENQKRQDVERQLAEAIAARDEAQRALQHVRDQMQHAVELTTKDAFRRGVESEREECAKLCDAEVWHATKRDGSSAGVAAGNCASAIRSRSNKA